MLTALLCAGLLAEQLNSVSYKTRAAIAETLPSLSGLLSRDIVRKLIDIMWCVPPFCDLK